MSLSISQHQWFCLFSDLTKLAAMDLNLICSKQMQISPLHWLSFLNVMRPGFQKNIHPASQLSVNNLFFSCLSYRFSKATPTQQTLPRRCCPNPHWHASSGSVPLPGKQASHCASRCMDVRYQVGTAEIHAEPHAYIHTLSALSLLKPVTENTLYQLYFNEILNYFKHIHEMMSWFRISSQVPVLV